jgi:hypothetical protein
VKQEKKNRMKLTGICILLLTLAGCGGSGGTASVSGTKDAKVEELLTLMKIEQMQKQAMDNVVQMISNQLKSQPDAAKAEEKEKRILALIADKTGWQNMKGTYIKVYSDTYNDSEIDGILLFYRSPAGKAMVDKQPALMSKMSSTMGDHMKELTPEIQKIMAE